MKAIPIFLVLVFSIFLWGCQKPWDILSAEEQKTLARIQAHWETWMPAKKAAGTAPLIDFEELTQGLDQESQMFLDRVRAVDPKKSFGFQGNFLTLSREGVKFKKLEGQTYIKNGEKKIIDPQYLPEPVYEAYEEMMQAMEKDLGKRLLVESGYRSPAYQLYTFLFYLPKHNFSLVETGHWVAIPGYSEHGAPHQQALDFISLEGENGDDDVEDFARLPEYEWLLAHGKNYGYVLSYPRGQKGIQFEPWHWSFRKNQVKKYLTKAQDRD